MLRAGGPAPKAGLGKRVPLGWCPSQPRAAWRSRGVVGCAAAQRSLYQVLEVSQYASVAEIKAAYRKKALKLHPDVNKAPDAHERFIECIDAFETLSDTAQRAAYDRQLNASRIGSSAAGRPSGGSSSWQSPGRTAPPSPPPPPKPAAPRPPPAPPRRPQGWDDMMRDWGSDFENWVKRVGTKTPGAGAGSAAGAKSRWEDPEMDTQQASGSGGSSSSTGGSSSGGGGAAGRRRSGGGDGRRRGSSSSAEQARQASERAQEAAAAAAREARRQVHKKHYDDIEQVLAEMKRKVNRGSNS